MISKEISKHILMVGPEFDPPMGGIAQILFNYKYNVFEPPFNTVENSCIGNRFKKLWFAISAIVMMFFKLLTNKKIKIVHIHTASYVSFKRSVIFEKLALMFKRKVVMHIHSGAFNTYFYGNPDFVKKNLKKCDSVIVLADNWKNFFVNEVGLHHVDIINNIVPLPAYTSTRIDPEKRICALFLGDIKHEKGIFDLLDVIVEHQNELRGSFVLHVGGGKDEVNIFLSQVKGKHVEDLVIFEGWVDEKRKNELLNQCNLLILPSYIEGLGVCILEAMSYRQSVISTFVGGIPTVIDSYKNGILIQPGDKPALWDAIRYHLEHRDVFEKFGSESLKRITRYYPEYVASQLERIYIRLLRE